MCPLSPGPLDGNGFLKRTSLVFTLVRNLGEVCQFNAFLVNVCCVFVAPMPDQVLEVSDISKMHILIWIYTLPLTNIFLSVALLALV